MIIHSIMPTEQIFAESDEKVNKVQEIHMNGLILQVEPTGAFEAKIIRMISPIAKDYLNPAYAPGQTVRFHPNR